MLTATTEETKPMRGATNDREASLLLEIAFSFAVKAAKRLVQLRPDDLDTVKRLIGELVNAPDNNARHEIMETILEMVLPDDRIGGVAKSNGQSRGSVRLKVNKARQFIGTQIKEHRERRRMTQVDLAKKAKIPQSHVSRLESGKHAPSRLTIERIAKALQLEPGQLDPGYNGRG